MNPLLLWDCEKPDPSKPLDVDQWEELRRQKRDAAVAELGKLKIDVCNVRKLP